MPKPFAQMILIILLSCIAAHAQATRPSTSQTDVPVKSVVLFSSGVGYFEHAGTVHGDGSTELRFKTSQINDILKSLVLQDLDGGRASTITYPSQDPIGKTLRSFQVDITNNPSLGDLLNQLRGAKVTVQSATEKIEGTVLGVEHRRKPVDKGEPVDVAVLNVLTGATIRAIELDSINNLSLDDPQLQEELNKALTALTQARDQDKKPVTLNFTGQGDRRIKIGYVVETPIWKTSYRLIMDDKGGKLQGWAIVENQTESDWNNVQLSLVSGRPISFVMDLYQPLYVARPVVQQELYASLRPQMYDAGMQQSQIQDMAVASAPAPGARGAFGGGGRGGGGGGGGAGGGRGAAPQQQMQRASEFSLNDMEKTLDATASIQSLASSGKMGELFQYTVGNVTLPRQKSAMIPIITDNVEVERLSIYNASTLPKNPLTGARLKNTTDKHLLTGPITVLDGNSYAGDARIDNVPPGQERLLSYGIDLELLVDNTKNSQTNTIVTGKIVKGVLELSRKLVSTQDYLTDNKSDKDKTIIIEHPIHQGWKLVDTPTPIETTQAVYRFKGTATAKKTSKLTVKEEIVQSDTLALSPADTSQLEYFSKTDEVPQKVRDAIGKAIQLKQGLVDIERQINEHNQQINEADADQKRARDNLAALSQQQQSQPYQRQIAKINDLDTLIDKLKAERDDLTKKRDAQRQQLEDYLNNLSVG